ncbi:PREDICTED: MULTISPECIES [Prunus dulcis]|uniref:PREDICTED: MULTISPECIES n=1 Tax=Prunus dulcis TaxID=3755 RepID=A0A5E4EHA4_PRUDU|nr:uncharacterized protein LOC117636458 [Prunus dulcis]KAI5315959.1 hypothetical protein L3X38_045135 [Prunus dulcis]VVA13951.1 PREDICTED: MULTISPECIES [Prunus dulcis]
MGTLSLLPLSLCSPLRPRLASSQTHLCNPVSWPLVSLTYPTPRRLRSKNVVFGSNSIDPKESEFLDENGVVDDMDGYMNYLSLEYDSVWDTKPSWCQPWTITLTGVLVIGGSWLILNSVVITVLAALLISTWWFIFLYSYPKAYADMIAERRSRVTNGVEDTFGLGKSQ